jgi:hypothetical protein
MKPFALLLLSMTFLSPASAQSLRLILVPQQITASRETSSKFDLFLYNAGKSPQTVPSLEEFRALYVVRRHTNSDEKRGTQLSAFSNPIKDHRLKAGGVDSTVIEIDLSAEDGEYIELHVEIGHDDHTLTSNPVLLLCPTMNVPTVEPASSPKSVRTP